MKAKTRGRPETATIHKFCYRCIHKHHKETPVSNGRGRSGIPLCPACEAEVGGRP